MRIDYDTHEYYDFYFRGAQGSPDMWHLEFVDWSSPISQQQHVHYIKRQTIYIDSNLSVYLRRLHSQKTLNSFVLVHQQQHADDDL